MGVNRLPSQYSTPMPMIRHTQLHKQWSRTIIFINVSTQNMITNNLNLSIVKYRRLSFSISTCPEEWPRPEYVLHRPESAHSLPLLGEFSAQMTWGKQQCPSDRALLEAIPCSLSITSYSLDSVVWDRVFLLRDSADKMLFGNRTTSYSSSSEREDNLLTKTPYAHSSSNLSSTHLVTRIKCDLDASLFSCTDWAFATGKTLDFNPTSARKLTIFEQTNRNCRKLITVFHPPSSLDAL